MQSDPSAAALIAGLESQGISQREIAQLAGVSRTTIWRMANDTNKAHLTSTIQRIESIERSLNIPPVQQK